MCPMHGLLVLAWCLSLYGAVICPVICGSPDAAGDVQALAVDQHTDALSTKLKFNDVIDLLHHGRQLTAAACGGTGQKCCRGKTPCKAKKAGCVFGTCRLPCGGLNMLCCNGFNGKLDFSGSSGSRRCNRAKSLVCYKGFCKSCGKLGKPCCTDTASCNQRGTTCHPKTKLCVVCGGLNQRCCAKSGPACKDLSKHTCTKVSRTSSKCLPKCGGTGQRCCSSKVPCKKSSNRCVDGKCAAPPSFCGGTGQPCCAGPLAMFPACKAAGDVCVASTCMTPCGARNMPCCSGKPTEVRQPGPGAVLVNGCNQAALLSCKPLKTGNTCVGYCGAKGEQCCDANPNPKAKSIRFCDGSGLFCNEKVGVCETCGGLNQKCCLPPAPAPACTAINTTICSISKTELKCVPCGGLDQPCCFLGSRFCNKNGLACNSVEPALGKCAPCGGLNQRCCWEAEGLLEKRPVCTKNLACNAMDVRFGTCTPSKPPSPGA